MPQTYSRLSTEERIIIMLCRDDNMPVPKIAEKIGRPPQTIYREIRRAGGTRYDATAAESAYRSRHAKSRRPKLLREGTPLFAHVQEKLIDEQWSPGQIAADLAGC